MVRPGEKIATDGVVVDGVSAVDASLVTGESVPVDVGPGSQVTGATINTSGRLLVRATRVGSETTLAQMGRLVSQAQTGKAPIARLADRISAVFVPVVLAIAVLTFAGWMLAAGPDITGPELRAAFTAAVAVLVIACPCALGLATPVGLLTGTGRGAQLGILIKGPQVLEDTRTVDTILLDKTGTVTTGQLAVDGIQGFGPFSEAEVLRLAGAVEARLRAPDRPRHRRRGSCGAGYEPAADTPAASADDGGLPAVVDFRSAPGGGVPGTVEGRRVTAGRQRLAGDERRRARRRRSWQALGAAEGDRGHRDLGRRGRRACRHHQPAGHAQAWIGRRGRAAHGAWACGPSC